MEQPIEQAEDAANHQPLPPVHLPVGPTQLGQGGALNFFYHNADTGHVQHSNDIVALLNLAISGERRLQRTSQSHEASAERSQTPRNGAVVLNPQGGGYHSAFYELA